MSPVVTFHLLTRGCARRGCAGAPVLSCESHGMPVGSLPGEAGEEGRDALSPGSSPGTRAVPAPRARYLPASPRHQAPAIKRRRRSIPPSPLPETRISEERATPGRRDVLFGDPDGAEQERSGDKGSGVSPPAEEDEAGGSVYSQGFCGSSPSGRAEEAGHFQRYCKALLCLLEGGLRSC